MTTLSLDALRDIHQPPEPILVVLLSPGSVIAMVTVFAVIAFWSVRRRLSQRPLRMAMREVDILASAYARDGETTPLVRGLSQLLRRYAVHHFGQARVAGLTDCVWLEFLDEHGGQGRFCSGAGEVLATRPYQLTGDFDAVALIALVRNWLQVNRP